MASGLLVKIVSGNDQLPAPGTGIAWTSADLLSVGPVGRNLKKSKYSDTKYSHINRENVFENHGSPNTLGHHQAQTVIKTKTYLSSYPGHFQEPHWKSVGLPEISRVTWQLRLKDFPKLLWQMNIWKFFSWSENIFQVSQHDFTKYCGFSSFNSLWPSGMIYISDLTTDSSRSW